MLWTAIRESPRQSTVTICWGCCGSPCSPRQQNRAGRQKKTLGCLDRQWSRETFPDCDQSRALKSATDMSKMGVLGSSSRSRFGRVLIQDQAQDQDLGHSQLKIKIKICNSTNSRSRSRFGQSQFKIKFKIKISIFVLQDQDQDQDFNFSFSRSRSSSRSQFLFFKVKIKIKILIFVFQDQI